MTSHHSSHRYDKKTRPKIVCFNILHGVVDSASPQQCYTFTPPVPTEGGYPALETADIPWKVEDRSDAVRHRTLSTKGGVDAVRMQSWREPFYPSYDVYNVVQPQLVVDEWASPLLDEKDRKAWHPFEHYVYRLDPSVTLRPFTVGHSRVAPSSVTYPWHDEVNFYHVGTHLDPFWGWSAGGAGLGVFDPRVGLPSFAVLPPSDDGTFVPYPESVAELREAALNSMLPRIRAETSGVNSLIELKDFQSLPHTLQRIQKTIGYLANFQLGILRKALRSHGVRGSAKVLAGDFLEWKFNVAPFISDVEAVTHQLDSIKAVIDRNLRNAGKVRRRHYNRLFKEYEPSQELVNYHTWQPEIGSIPYGTPVWFETKMTRQVFSDLTKFHAEIEYSYYYSGFQREHARMLSLLDGLGVNLNFATIWRAIPWSFVVDWVVGVGRFLDTLKLRNMDPTLRVDRYLWSVLRRRHMVSRIEHTPDYAANVPRGTNHSIVLPTAYESSYGRWTTLPDNISFATSELDSEESTLATALALSRGRRSKRSLKSLLRPGMSRKRLGKVVSALDKFLRGTAEKYDW